MNLRGLAFREQAGERLNIVHWSVHGGINSSFCEEPGVTRELPDLNWNALVPGTSRRVVVKPIERLFDVFTYRKWQRTKARPRRFDSGVLAYGKVKRRQIGHDGSTRPIASMSDRVDEPFELDPRQCRSGSPTTCRVQRAFRARSRADHRQP